MKAAGGKWNKLKLQEIAPGNNTLLATYDIKYGEYIASIPYEMYISEEVIRNSDFFASYKDFGLELEEIQYGLFLLEERRNPMSEWQDFFALQPKIWDTEITLWTTDEVRMLEGSKVGEAIPIMKDALLKKYDMIAEKIPDFSLKYSVRDWLEVNAADTSRRYGNRPSGSSVLLPLGDLFNHANPPAAKWFWVEREDEKLNWSMQAMRDIARGEEVSTTYGTHDNMDLLVTYGFILPDNPKALKVDITYEAVNLQADDPLRDLKREVIDEGFKIDKRFSTLTNNVVRKQLRFIVFDDRDKIVETEDGLKVEYIGIASKKT